MSEFHERLSARRQLEAAKALWLETLGFFGAIALVVLFGILRGFTSSYLVFAATFVVIYAVVLAISYARLLRRYDFMPRALEEAALRSLRARSDRQGGAGSPRNDGKQD